MHKKQGCKAAPLQSAWQALSILDAQSHTVGISIKGQTLARTEEVSGFR